MKKTLPVLIALSLSLLTSNAASGIKLSALRETNRLNSTDLFLVSIGTNSWSVNVSNLSLSLDRVQSRFFSDTWTPTTDDTNTVAWWRSYAGVTSDSSSNVLEVADGSGFGRPLKQTLATEYPFALSNGLAGGKSSLLFDGSNDWLATTNFGFEQPATIYFLYKQVTWTSGRRVFNGLIAADGAATNAYVYETSSSPYVFQRTGSATGAGLNRHALGTWGSLITVWDGSSSKISFDGFSQAGGSPASGGFGGIAIASSESGALNSNIEFGEMICRAGTDSEDTRLKTSRYLKRVAGQPFNLLVADGNSLTEGAGVAISTLWYNQVLTNYLPTTTAWHVKMLAAGGETTSNMLLRAETTDSYFHENNATNVLTAWEISNELYGGVSTNQAYSNFTNYCAGRRAEGFKVIAFTVIDRTNGPAAFDNDRANVNDLIRRNYLSFANGLADVATNGFLGCNDCGATNTYFADGTHLTAAGHTIVANIVTNAISKIQQ